MIEFLIKQIAEKIPASSGANLSGFTQDLDYALWKSKDNIISYKISTTKHPQRLITVEAEIADNVKDLQKVFETVEIIWTSVIYRYFEASSYQYYKEAAVLRFVTIVKSEQFFVSGAIVLQGEKYHKLISEHQQKIEKSYDSLPTMTPFEN
jgi:hypothetical protein